MTQSKEIANLYKCLYEENRSKYWDLEKQILKVIVDNQILNSSMRDLSIKVSSYKQPCLKSTTDCAAQTEEVESEPCVHFDGVTHTKLKNLVILF